jgi:hypothetical protein
MTTILDLELTARLGALDPAAAADVEQRATAAFLWRGLSQSAALDLARGLQWVALGHPADLPAGPTLARLALAPLTGPVLADLARRLDDADRLDCARERLTDLDRSTGLRRLGRRLALAVALLDGEELPLPA